MALPADYLDRVYAGVLGKIIGVYLGRPFEQWSHEKIVAELGDIAYYVHDQIGKPLVVVDDDISGTFTFIRTLEDQPGGFGLSADSVGKTWLNYLVEERSVLWWGGLGFSTEHTAYLRLKAGVPGSRSGSMQLNGPVVSQQIGAQIFTDGWSLVCPGEPAKAAALATQAARVSHDGDALFAVQVIAAMGSAAFVQRDLQKLLDTALSFIPRDCLVARLIGELRELRRRESDWHSAQEFLARHWGYDKFQGGCHILPNHAVIIMALLWGDDDFQKSLLIANTAGLDTDCNSGNVGCLLGIKNGLAAIDAGPDWRGPVADRMYIVSADGARCINDAASTAVWVCNLGRGLAGEKPIAPKNGARFHFDLPGSVQGWLADSTAGAFPGLKLENAAGRGLALRYRHLAPGQTARAVVQTSLYVGQADAGYWLCGCPTLNNGQTVRCAIGADSANPHPITASLALFTWTDGDKPLRIPGPSATLVPGHTRTLEWRVASPPGQPIVQLAVELSSEHTTIGSAYLDYLTWSGTPDLTLGVPAAKESNMWRRAWIDALDRMNWGATPGRDEDFSLCQNHGRGLLVYGGREWGRHRVAATVRTPLAKSIGIAARVVGLRRYYALLITGQTAQLVKMRDEQTVLAEKPFHTQAMQRVRLSLTIDGSRIRASIDDQQLFDITDRDAPFTDGGIALICEEGGLVSGPVRVEAITT